MTDQHVIRSENYIIELSLVFCKLPIIMSLLMHYIYNIVIGCKITFTFLLIKRENRKYYTLHVVCARKQFV